MTEILVITAAVFLAGGYLGWRMLKKFRKRGGGGACCGSGCKVRKP